MTPEEEFINAFRSDCCHDCQKCEIKGACRAVNNGSGPETWTIEIIRAFASKHK